MATPLVSKQHFISWGADNQFAYLFALFESIQDANVHTKKIYIRMCTHREEFTQSLLERVYDACKAIEDRNKGVQEESMKKAYLAQKQSLAQIKRKEQQATAEECIDDILLVL